MMTREYQLKPVIFTDLEDCVATSLIILFRRF